MCVHKIKRKITNENLNEEVMKATRDLFDVANQPIYHKGKRRLFGYFNNVFIDIYETAPDIALDYIVQSNAISANRSTHQHILLLKASNSGASTERLGVLNHAKTARYV